MKVLLTVICVLIIFLGIPACAGGIVVDIWTSTNIWEPTTGSRIAMTSFILVPIAIMLLYLMHGE